MENTGLHLLENSPEAAEMRAKVRDMLLSDDAGNQRLAFQLIRGGGFHEEFAAPLLAFLLSQRVSMNFENLARYYQDVWEQMPQKELIAFVEEHIARFDTYLYPELAEEWREIPALQPYWRDLVGCFFLLTKWGDKLCAKYQIFDLNFIIQKLDGAYIAYFNDFEWRGLPEGLAHIQAPNIVLLGNPLDEVRQASWRNYNTKHLDLDRSIDIKTCRKIISHFPHAADATCLSLGGYFTQRKLWNGGANAMQISAEMAIQFYRLVSPAGRDEDYYHDRGRAYTNAGRYEIALYCHKQVFQYHKGAVGDYYYKLACALAHLGRRGEMLWILAQLCAFNPSFAGSISEDGDFEAYWEDADFILLLDARGEMPDEEYTQFIQRFSVPLSL